MNAFRIAKIIQEDFKENEGGAFTLDCVFGVGNGLFDVWVNVSVANTDGKYVCVDIGATQYEFRFYTLESDDCSADPIPHNAFFKENAIVYGLDYTELLALSDKEQVEKLMPLAKQIYDLCRKVTHTIADTIGVRAYC